VIKQLIENGESEQIFQRTIQEHGRGQVCDFFIIYVVWDLNGCRLFEVRIVFIFLIQTLHRLSIMPVAHDSGLGGFVTVKQFQFTCLSN
jgi:hypothetical protein